MTGIPTFATPPSFMGLTRPATDARMHIAGVPLDIGTTNRSGARFGPHAIRHASRMLVDGDHPRCWRDPVDLPVADIGDFQIALGDIAKSLDLIQQQAAAFAHLIVLGGEHGISLALLRALVARRGAPVALVHFDAHVDTWPESFGQSFGHGSPFFHAINEGLIDPHHSVQIGIRSPVARGIWDWTIEKGITILTAEHVHEIGAAAAAARIIEIVGTAPAFAPGTGTPEIGGLASWQAQAILRRLGGLNFVGMDIVEVAPAYDVSEITALAAATIVWEYLALRA